jgi:hypothetical protein
MPRTWNLDGLRKHAKAKKEMTSSGGRHVRRHISSGCTAPDMEPCSICGHSKWWHKTTQPGETNHEWSAAETAEQGVSDGKQK